LSLTVAASAFAETGAETEPASAAKEMVIVRAGSQASYKGPAQYFTGTVRVDPLFGAHAPSSTSGAAVTFEPGARSA
jgi:quercetin dioxygenase-like cupin family protein